MKILATELNIGDQIEFKSLNPKRYLPESGTGVAVKFSIDRPHEVIVHTEVPFEIPTANGTILTAFHYADISIDDRTHSIDRVVRAVAGSGPD
jgi:hypothetical protein